MAPLLTQAEAGNKNDVKVVTDVDDFALYFSREAIPSSRMGHFNGPWYKQVPIIPFRRVFYCVLMPW